MVQGVCCVMDVGGFLIWLQHSKVGERCEAAQSIARAALDRSLELEERCVAEAALALLLEDPSSKVRRAVADILSLHPHASAAMLDALARDQFDVAAPVLARSKLGEETLLAALANGHPDGCVLIADRAEVAARVAMEIARTCDVRACLALLTNPQADCGADVLDMMIERHADTSADLRGALITDARLTLAQRQRLVLAAGRALGASPFVARVIGQSRADALQREAVAETPLLLVADAEPAALPPYVRSLRDAGRLTANLLMKALVHGRIDFVASCLCELSARRIDQVRDILVKGGEGAVGALLRDVGFKSGMMGVALEALKLWRDVAGGRIDIGRQEIAWRLMTRAEAERQAGRAENDDLIALLRRIYLDVARANAQAHARSVLEDARQEAAAQEFVALALEEEFAELFVIEPESEAGAAILGLADATLDDENGLSDDMFDFDIELEALPHVEPVEPAPPGSGRGPAPVAEMDDDTFIASLDAIMRDERRAA